MMTTKNYVNDHHGVCEVANKHLHESADDEDDEKLQSIMIKCVLH